MNINNRTDNIKNINDNGSTGSMDKNNVVVSNKSELNQKSESQFNSYINSGNSTSAFMEIVEGS